MDFASILPIRTIRDIAGYPDYSFIANALANVHTLYKVEGRAEDFFWEGTKYATSARP